MTLAAKASLADVIAAIDELPTSVPVAVVTTDLDEFQSINVEHGPAAGDAVLAAFENVLRRNLPDDAQVIRVGGDEWIAVLPRASAERALVVIDEIRQHVEQAELAPNGRSITMSAGVASRPPHGVTGEELLRCADEALFRGKREGRNRVAIYVEDRMVMKSNYYSRGALERLARVSRVTDRTEASLLREALDNLLAQYTDLT